MFETLESGIGLDIVIWLQDHSNPLFDALAEMLHYMGSSVFYIALLPIFYWSYNKVFGRQLLFALLFSSLAFLSLKNIVEAPRPHMAYPEEVTALVEEEGYGFPSGHTASTLVLMGLAASWINRQWAWMLAIAAALIMGWGRMVAGVHYPQDVLGGMLVGAMVLWFLIGQRARFTSLWNAIPLYIHVGLIIGATALIGYTIRDENSLMLTGVLLGVSLGNLVEDWPIEFEVHGTFSQRVMRYVVGVLIVMAVLFGL
ncbi:MAG: phosphatase PAP2 family protein [Chloroflexi bacterium]|nr:phosphatase PAP2 family protein [Chloroflexota bacterium]